MSNYLNFHVNSEEAIMSWILRQLGHPLVDVEIHEDQLRDCVNDAIEEFTKYVIQEEQYLSLNLEDYNTSGYTLPNNVAGIFSMEESMYGNNQGGINTLFSIQNSMWNAGMLTIPNAGSSGGWINYEMAMQYIDLIHRLTAAKFYFEYNERNKLLTLIPNPTLVEMKGYICIGCNVIRPDDQHFGESWVKRYALARAKIIVGMHRTKYSQTTLLGGGSIDQTIRAEGLAEMKDLKDELIKTYNTCKFFVG